MTISPSDREVLKKITEYFDREAAISRRAAAEWRTRALRAEAREARWTFAFGLVCVVLGWKLVAG